MQLLKITRLIAPLALLAGGASGGCEDDPPPSPPETEVTAAVSPCPSGRSDDPSRRELVKAHRLFRAQKYAAARALLDRLLEEKPKSATTLAARGDATLFDDALGYEAAARQARGYYDRASAIVGQGCAVSRRTEYYLHMGDAFAALRLAPRAEGFDGRELDRAEAALELAEERWPKSAEVHYNLARVHCARGQVDGCVDRFQRALEAAESLERPRFLRTHRSTEDWIVRSETQSELGPLRGDPRYRSIIDAARARKRERDEGAPSKGESKGETRERQRDEGPGGRLRLRPDPRPPAKLQ